MTTPDRMSADAIQSLVHVGELRDHVEDLQDQLREHVSYARQQGATWRMIGVALGVTAQSAWERYSGHERDSEIPQQEVLLTREQVMDDSWLDVRPSVDELERMAEEREQAEHAEQVAAAAEIIKRRADF